MSNLTQSDQMLITKIFIVLFDNVGLSNSGKSADMLLSLRMNGCVDVLQRTLFWKNLTGSLILAGGKHQSLTCVDVTTRDMLINY